MRHLSLRQLLWNSSFLILSLFLGCHYRYTFPSSHSNDAKIRVEKNKLEKLPETCEEFTESLTSIEFLSDALVRKSNLFPDLKNDTTGIGTLASEYRKLDSLRELVNYTILEKDPLCMGPYLYYGIPAAIGVIEDKNNLEKAKDWLLPALKFAPKEPLLNFLLAFAYDMADSVKQSLVYYERAKFYNDEHNTTRKIYNILNQEEIFDSFNKKTQSSFIKVTRRRTTNHSPTWNDAPYVKLHANGSLELYEYFGKSDKPYLFKNTISDSLANQYFKTLRNIRFLSLFRPFSSDDSPHSRAGTYGDFVVLPDWMLPEYSVELSTPLGEHSVKIYGLNHIDSAYSDNPPSLEFIDTLHHIRFNSPVIPRLVELSKISKALFDTSFIYKQIGKLYGDYQFSDYGNTKSKDYIYVEKDSSFIHLGFPDYQPIWKTSVTANINPALDKIHQYEIFLLPGAVYGLHPNSGQIKFKKTYDPEKYSHVIIHQRYLKMGYKIAHTIFVDFYQISDLDFVCTLKIDKDNTVKLLGSDPGYFFDVQHHQKDMLMIKKEINDNPRL
ncbi:MAG: hypothetical protein HQK83_02415 [Fibrobacteria bacterium]|nr:hypothetical protein [Fibrobacteria bacterium]